MKKHFLLGAFLLVATIINAQNIAFTDVNFKNFLTQSTGLTSWNLQGVQTAIDLNKDGEIEQTEAENIGILLINNTQITSLEGIENFKNLKRFTCIGNQITSLNLSNLSKLEFLECRDNLKLKSVNISGLNNLQDINITRNGLTSLVFTSLEKAKKIQLYGNQFTDLTIEELPNLQELSLGESSLHKNLTVKNCPLLKIINAQSGGIENLILSDLNSLEELYLNNQKITALNTSTLNNLKQINISTNLLTQLDFSKNLKLERISCDRNKLTTLTLGDKPELNELYCEVNNLTILDDLSNAKKLRLLNCSNNKLKTLDVSLNPLLQDIACATNELEFLSLKNGLSGYFSFNFLQNPNLKFVCCDLDDEEAIKKEIIRLKFNKASVSTYCSFTPGGDYNIIKGKVNFDKKLNQCSSESHPYDQLKIKVTSGNTTGYTYTNKKGEYVVYTQKGTHVIAPMVGDQHYNILSSTENPINFLDNKNNVTIKDFCLAPKEEKLKDLEVKILHTMTEPPGFVNKFLLTYRNLGNEVINGKVELFLNRDIIDYLKFNIQPVEKSKGLFVWTYTDLKPFETREIYFELATNKPTDPNFPVNAGDIFEARGDAFELNAQDEILNQDTFQHVNVITNSLDPNDKTCLQGESISPAMVGQYLDYIIRFENLGTANAKFVVIKDIIDTNVFDVESFEVTSASHNYKLDITQGNKLEFFFENINLPFDNDNNDGFVAFKIKTKTDLKLGTQIKNKAEIFFDFNFPIITNEYVTTVKEPTLSISNEDQLLNGNRELIAYPNPTQDILFFNIEVDQIEIYNTNGQLLKSHQLKSNSIDLSELPHGLYFIKLVAQNKTHVQKLLKE